MDNGYSRAQGQYDDQEPRETAYDAWYDSNWDDMLADYARDYLGEEDLYALIEWLCQHPQKEPMTVQEAARAFIQAKPKLLASFQDWMVQEWERLEENAREDAHGGD